MKYIYENWLERHGRYPSTGILSLVFALHVCDEVRSVCGWIHGQKIRTFHTEEPGTNAGYSLSFGFPLSPCLHLFKHVQTPQKHTQVTMMDFFLMSANCRVYDALQEIIIKYKQRFQLL